MRRYGHLAAVAVGGSIGALARWSAVQAVEPDYAIAVVLGLNTVGSALAGAIAARRGLMRRHIEHLLGAGFAGGLTTFSTFAVTLADFLDRGAMLDALAYAGATIVSTLVAAGLGYRIGRP